MKNDLERNVLNVDKANLAPLWTVKELDDCILKLSLFKNNVAFDVTGQTLSLGAKTSKGIIEQVDGFTINANELDIELKNSILVPGVVEIDLELKDANGIMTTASFFITVESRVLNDTAVQSTNEFDTFSKTVAKVEEDYNSLRRIIIDENQAANLQDQVNKTNAQLDNKMNFFDENYSKTINKYYGLGSQSLKGSSKHSPTIIQQNDKDYTLNVYGNESTIEHLKLLNENGFVNKIGLNIGLSQRHHLSDLFISGYDVGVSLVKSYYNYFEDIFINECNTGILIGDAVNPSLWVGAMTFNTIRFNNDKIGVNIETIDTTNSIIFDKCSFEGVNHCFNNKGQLHVKNTYFGDQNQINENEESADYLLKAFKGSKTRFTECNLGVVNRNYSYGSDDNKVLTGIVILDGTDTEPCEVYLKDCNIQLSNNNNPTCLNGLTTFYTSNNKNNKLYLDNVDFIPSTSNKFHNYIPFILYDGYSCLHSLNPIKNYVLNGNFQNDNENELIANSYNGKITFNDTLINPFHGKVMNIAKDTNFKIKYKVPKHLVNKEMTLEFYVCNCSTNYVRVNKIASDCVENTDFYYQAPNINYENKAPIMYRTQFTPSKEIGEICFSNKWDATDDLILAGIILKENQYKNKLSCYIQDDYNIYNTSIPTVGKWRIGDKVYNTNPKANSYEGWVCIDGDGTSVGTWKGFGLIET